MPTPKAVLEGDEVVVLRGEKCPSEAHVLIVVQQLQGAGLRPAFPLSLYTIEQLKALTEQYAERQQQRRRETEEDVYIAGNVTSGGCGSPSWVVNALTLLCSLPPISLHLLPPGQWPGGWWVQELSIEVWTALHSCSVRHTA